MAAHSMDILEEITRVQKAVNATRPIEIGKPIELTSEAAEVALSTMHEYSDKLLDLLKPVGVTSIASFLHDYERHEYGTPITDDMVRALDNSIFFRLDIARDGMLTIFIRPTEGLVHYGGSSIHLLEITDWDSVHSLVEKFIDEVRSYISE